ncbi:MAG: hypothetical protein IPN76_17340 [Saprospiraceae bacterium]|nr:hypothetical protein [Saprospiraceae bacterium]
MKVLNYANSKAIAGTLQHITWATGDLVGSDGKIRITLPDENGGQQMVFDLVGSFFTSGTDYAITGKNSLGQISLCATSIGKGGTLNLGSNTYELYPLGNSKGLLIKKIYSSESSDCLNSEPETPSIPAGYCEDNCGSGVLDVLYMITPTAQQWLNDTYGIFGGWFTYLEAMEFNLALANSQIVGKRARFRFIDYTPAFPFGVGGNIINNDCGDLNDPVNGMPSHAVLTLQQYGADVGIVLVNIPFNGNGDGYGLGNATSDTDPAFTGGKFACVQSYAIDRATYTHELGHHFGCKHGYDGNTSPACANGKRLQSNTTGTMMASGVSVRIPYFSNPDVNYPDTGESTGETGTRDNAAQIDGAFCIVASNNPPTYFGATYTHSSQIGFGCPFTATASVDPGVQELPSIGLIFDCLGPYTYQWSWSPTYLGTYTAIGSNSPNLSLPSPPNCPKFYLKLRVTTGSCEVQHLKLIFCEPNSACVRSNEQVLEDDMMSKGYKIIPNPAFDKIRIQLSDFGAVENITAISATGLVTKLVNPTEFSDGELTCDVSGFSPGLWFLKIKGKEKDVSLKLAIVR